MLGLGHFKIAYIDHNTKHTSGIVREKEWCAHGFTLNGAMVSALKSFTKENPKCDIIRVLKRGYLTQLDRLDKGETLTGLGFRPED